MATPDPRVVVDGRPLVGNRTGVGVHTVEIAKRLRFAHPPLIASHVEISDRHGLENCAFHVDGYRRGLVWQQFRLPRIEGDVFWGPHGTLPLLLRRPAVISLHDFSSLDMPHRHRLRTILSFNPFIGRSLRMAHRIAAVTRAVADDAMRRFGLDAAKIEIVPNGVDEFFTPGTAGEGDHVLYVGTLEPRKGIDLLIDAWRSLPHPRPRLVLCGDAGWRTRVDPREGIEVTGYVSRERLRELYRTARVFVYPSRYEGFGLPPLEAMASGAAVIATRTGAIPEYAEGAALLVDPNDGRALADALRDLLGDASRRSELRARGPDRAKRFRWDESARLMSELLRQAAQRG